MAPIISAFLAQKRQDPNLDCSTATPWALFIFFTSNYLAHCATVKMYPGSSPADTVIATALALFLPSSGVTRAIHWISRNSWFKKKNPLEKAAMAGALRMVVRNAAWGPREGNRIGPVYLDGGETELFPQISPSPGANKDAVIHNTNEIKPTTNMTPTETADTSPEKSRQPPMRRFPQPFEVRVEGHPRGMRGIEYQLSAPVSSLKHSEKDCPTLHGNFFLPTGYSWAEVPAEAKISFAIPASHTEAPSHAPAVASPPSICSNYNWVQSLVGLFQAISAGLTLYRSRGDQIERYGYAAFGLTVVPYLIMSILNLVAQLATAEYSTLFMVSSPEMEEARRRGGIFDGAVGSLDVDEWDGKAGTTEPVYEARFVGSGSTASIEVTRLNGNSSVNPVTVRGRWSRHSETENRVRLRIPEYTTFKLDKYPSGYFLRWSFLYFALPILVGCLSLLIVGALTHFREGGSSKAQRAWMMSWLVVGIACGWWADLVSGLFVAQREEETGKISKGFYVCQLVTCVLFLGVFCAPAIGGFVVVAQMLGEYGICGSG